MSNTVKNTFQFLWPYILGLLIIRLGIDVIIKQFIPTLSGASLGQGISLVVELIFLFLTINNYKKFKNNGSLMFSEGIKVGLGLILVFGITFSIYIVLHGKYIDPTYQENIAREFAEKAGQEYHEAKDNMVFIGLASSVIRYIFIGALGSIICSAILKTEK